MEHPRGRSTVSTGKGVSQWNKGESQVSGRGNLTGVWVGNGEI